MPQVRYETTINRPTPQIFELLADLPNYPRWLDSSKIYSDTVLATTAPTKLGTTYTDVGKAAKMQGAVTEFEPPRRLTFQQKTQIKLVGVKGDLTIQIQYTLNPLADRTQVVREVTYKTVGVFRLLGWLVSGNVHKESPRILQKMKTYLESQA